MLMPPNSQNQSPPPQQPPNNPYDFINNQPSNNKLPVDLSSNKTKLILAGGVLALLFLVFILFSAIFGGGDEEQTLKYVDIAKSQTEIIRLASLAEDNAGLIETRSLALTTKYSTQTSRQELTDILKKRGVNEKDLNKRLSASKNAESDELLDEAKKNNRYDETFKKIIFQEIEDYQKELQSASSGATSKELQTLEDVNGQVETILFNN